MEKGLEERNEPGSMRGHLPGEKKWRWLLSSGFTRRALLLGLHANLPCLPHEDF